MPRPVSASAPDGDGAPSAVEHREGFVLEKQPSQELVSVCAWGGKITQLLPRGLRNVH